MDEAAKTAHVRIDTAAPATADNADTRWHNRAVAVALTATDAASGVLGTGYSLDDEHCLSGTAVVIAAPGDHGNDGVHTLAYSSLNNVRNSEAARTCSVCIDTRRPSTAGPNASSVRRGFWAKVRFRVNDAPPSAGTAKVVIRVRGSWGCRSHRRVTGHSRHLSRQPKARHRESEQARCPGQRDAEGG